MTDLLAAAERFSAGYPSVNEQCEADTLALANFATALLTDPEARAALERLRRILSGETRSYLTEQWNSDCENVAVAVAETLSAPSSPL
jgi:hypothetical protein